MFRQYFYQSEIFSQKFTKHIYICLRCHVGTMFRRDFYQYPIFLDLVKKVFPKPSNHRLGLIFISPNFIIFCNFGPLPSSITQFFIISNFLFFYSNFLNLIHFGELLFIFIFYFLVQILQDFNIIFIIFFGFLELFHQDLYFWSLRIP